MGCQTSRAVNASNPVRTPTTVNPIEKRAEKATVEKSYYESSENHTEPVEICSDLFQFLPSILPYKLYESSHGLKIDLFECLSDLQKENKDFEVVLQREKHDSQRIADKESDAVLKIVQDYDDEIYQFAEKLLKDDDRLIKQLQQAQQHDVATAISSAKLDLRNESINYLNSVMQQRNSYDAYQTALDTILERRMVMCAIWYERWMTRKRDWNDARNKIRDTLLAIANRLGISQIKQDDMMTELSKKIIEIRQDFEISLDNAFHDLKDELIPKLKKDLRDQIANLLQMNEANSERVNRNNNVINIEHRLLQRLVIIAEHDYNSTYYMIRKIAQIEAKVGNDMIVLFEQFMRDLSTDRAKLRDVQDLVDQSERKRNRSSRDALDDLEKNKFQLSNKTSNSSSTSNKSSDLLDRLKLIISDDISAATKKYAENLEKNRDQIDSHKFTEKWIGSILSDFNDISSQRMRSTKNSTKDQQSQEYSEYEISHINLLLHHFKKSEKISPTDGGKTSETDLYNFIGQQLLNQKLNEVSAVQTKQNILQALVDLRGILFLVIYENPLPNISQDQLYQIYEKTKSESERLERKKKTNMNEINMEKENNENIAERFLRVSSRNNGIELNVILRDSAMETVSLEQEFTRDSARSNTFYTHTVDGIRSKIEQEFYILNKLVQSLSLSEGNIELILQEISSLTQKEVEDIIYKISPPVKGKADGKLLDTIEEYSRTYTERKGQMYDYLRHGIASSSFERRVRLKIPKNDVRESSLASPFHTRPQSAQIENRSLHKKHFGESDSDESLMKFDEDGPTFSQSYKKESSIMRNKSFIRDSVSTNIYRASPNQFHDTVQSTTYDLSKSKPPARKGLSQLRAPN